MDIGHGRRRGKSFPVDGRESFSGGRIRAITLRVRSQILRWRYEENGVAGTWIIRLGGSF